MFGKRSYSAKSGNWSSASSPKKKGAKKRSLGKKLDSALFGIQHNAATARRAIYRAGYVAGSSRSNPKRDIAAVIADLEKTAIFRAAAAGDMAVVREFYLAGYHDAQKDQNNPGAFAKCMAAVPKKGGGKRKAAAVKRNRPKVKRNRPKVKRNGPKVKRNGPVKRNPYRVVETDKKGKVLEVVFIADTLKVAREHMKAQRKLGGHFKVQRNPKKNPLDTAQSAYAGFHGESSKKTVVIQERRHYHTHVWALGPLVLLKVWLPKDRRKPGLRNFVEIQFDYEGKNPVFVTANEKRNQMFLDGGDQSVDLKVFSVPPEPHETVVLGEVSDAWYFTTKKHLGKDGGTAVYKHRLGEEGGELPTLIYHVLEKHLSLAGGSYTIPNEGVRN